MTYTLHPKVEEDLDEAAAHLAAHVSPRTVARFLAEFERVVHLLMEHPGIGTPISRGRKIHPFRVFRYSVIYRLVDGQPRVLVVRHKPATKGELWRRAPVAGTVTRRRLTPLQGLPPVSRARWSQYAVFGIRLFGCSRRAAPVETEVAPRPRRQGLVLTGAARRPRWPGERRLETSGLRAPGAALAVRLLPVAPS
jgi:plasmid stabilization system protein ParE